MKIKFPTKFNVNYPKKNLKYYNYGNRKKIMSILQTASNGYCMYCGNKVIINNKNYGQVEHSVEKCQSGIELETLKHCKFNMSLACPTCNMSFKKRFIYPIDIDIQHKCLASCEEICDTYKKYYESHYKKNSIILMPNGINVVERNLNYEIEYDLLRLLFLPSSNKFYNEEDLFIIQSHIDRFNLNNPEFIPKDVIQVCEYYLDTNRVPEKMLYNNILADKLIDYLNKIKEENKKSLEIICEIILIFSTL